MRNWRDGLGLGSIIRGFTDGWNYRRLLSPEHETKGNGLKDL